MLVKNIMEINEKILGMQQQIIKKQFEILNGEERAKIQELGIINEIANVIDLNGKPKYSNESKRRAAFNELMTEDHPLTVLKKQLKDDDFKLKLKRVECDFLLRQLDILIKFSKDGDKNDSSKLNTWNFKRLSWVWIWRRFKSS